MGDYTVQQYPVQPYQQPVQPYQGQNAPYQNPNMQVAAALGAQPQAAPPAFNAMQPTAPAVNFPADSLQEAATSDPGFMDKIRNMPPNKLAAIISAFGTMASMAGAKNEFQAQQAAAIGGIGSGVVNSMTASDAAKTMAGGSSGLTPDKEAGPTTRTFNADGTYHEKGNLPKDKMSVGGQFASPNF